MAWYSKRIALFLFLILLIAPAPIDAQDQATPCPDLTALALTRVGDACEGLERNQVCYGNPLLDTTFREADVALRFVEPSDRVPVGILDTLRTLPMDPVTGVWGVGVMRIQANLPDARPGEAVTFLLFGDVTLQNTGAEEQPPIPEPCAATTRAPATGRSGPGDAFPVQVVLAVGESVWITGRDSRGAWARVETGEQVAWLPTEAVQTACDLSAFPVFDENGPAVYGPMQAFYFSSGFGEPICKEVPPSSLVIQTPAGVHVTLSVNGVNVTVGSTVVLHAAPHGDMIVATLQGRASVRAEGETRVVPPGFMTSVPLGGANGLEPEGPPTPVELADLDAYAALTQVPASLLYEPITIPDAEAIEALSSVLCGDGTCQATEDSATCATDCGAGICNGVCDGTDCIDCPSDCRPSQCYWCGNGTCDPIESAETCPTDCVSAAESVGGGDDDDLAKLCGDEICQGYESAETCPQDCEGGRLCGDGVCQGHESAETCPQDCGGGGRLCGDGICQGNESAETCPQDCGG